MPSSPTGPSPRSPEFQNQVNEVKSRLTDFIEATRPAHEANLRRAAAFHSTSEPEEKSDQPKTPRPPRKATNPSSVDAHSPESGSPLERHSRKCKICNHPNREAFEADFLDWCQASWLERTYHIRDEATIYRHARATGLLQRRRENVRMVAEKLLEHVDSIDTPSAFAILRAVRTLACLNERGQWAEPSTTHIVVNTTQPPVHSPDPVTTSGAIVEPVLVPSATDPTPGASPTVGVQSARHSPLVTSHCLPNRQSYEKLELDVTDTKHTPEVVSNRQ